MKQPNLLKLSLLAFLAMILVACPKKNKCNPDCDTVVDAPKEFLDYWFFNTGSYWVYKLADTSATILDTVKITFSKTSFVSACENVP